jgi:hypothetical protein
LCCRLYKHVFCRFNKMADTKRSRAAKLGARTRARNVSLHGPSQRSSARSTEDRRILAGGHTLADAYGGVPSRTNFLKQAHLFERATEGSSSTKTDRAYIVPDGLQTLRRGAEVDLFWYRRNSSVECPSEFESTKVTAKDGEQYILRAMEDAPQGWQTKMGSQTFARSCTGIVRYYVS